MPPLVCFGLAIVYGYNAFPSNFVKTRIELALPTPIQALGDLRSIL
jgi:hypothetical protein